MAEPWRLQLGLRLLPDTVTVKPKSRREPPRTTVASVARDYVPALGAFGILLYGILRLAYVFFYLQLRTTPEEVGYGYSQILSESIAGAVELTLLCAAVFVLLAACVYILRLFVLTLAGRFKHSTTARRQSFAHYFRTVTLWSLAAGAALVTTQLARLGLVAGWAGQRRSDREERLFRRSPVSARTRSTRSTRRRRLGGR